MKEKRVAAGITRQALMMGASIALVCLISFFALISSAFAANDGSANVAVDPSDKDSAGFAAVVYDNLNGLPTSEANDIAETSEGFMWIGGYGGLVRYDGDQFETISPAESGINSVTCLYVDKKDRLWVGTNDSGVIMIERGKYTRWDEGDGLPASSVRSILEDENGTYYISTTGGIAMIDHNLNIYPFNDSRMDSYMKGLAVTSDGRIYGLSNNGDLFVIRGGEVEEYYSRDEIKGEGGNTLFPDPKNPDMIYLETSNSEVMYGDPKKGFDKMKKIDISPLYQVTSFQYVGGKIWVCARNGLGILDEKGCRTVDNLPMNNSVVRIISDYAGNLWFASTKQGVMKVVPNRFRNLTAEYGMEEMVVNSTCKYDGKLFIATDTGLRILDDKGPVDSVPVTKAVTASGSALDVTDLAEMLSGTRIRSIIRDSSDRIWISTWRDSGLLRFDKGELTAFTQEDGLFSDQIRTVYERTDGSFLVACSGGVNIIEGDKVTAGFGEKDGITNSEILTVCEADNGDIICGSDGGGIFVIGSNGMRAITKRDGLSSESVMRIKRDRNSDNYWVISGTSLAYMTPNYEIRTIETFPYTNNFDLYETKDGDVWVLSGNGIYIDAEQNLIADNARSASHYGVLNGLPCVANANSYSEFTEDGTLYIAGTKGVTEVDTNVRKESIGEIKATIAYVDADGERIYADDSGKFDIKSDVSKVTIYPYVFNYSLTNPIVRYKLKGFDKTEKTVMRDELNPIDYTNLKGGDYVFTMDVYDPSRREVKTVSAPINKVRSLYEQPLFYVAAGLIAALVLYIFFSAYMNQRLLQAEEKHKEEANRERITTELNTAKQIQEGVLPNDFPAFPERDDFDIYATMEPAREVGGDFYDFFLIDDDHLGMVMADVSGKGIPAALLMMVAKSIIKNLALYGISPSEVLRQANESLCSNNELDMFITVWLGVLELSSGRLTAANAGHEYPVHRKADGQFELIKDKHGLVLGGMEGMKYTDYEWKLGEGDKIFLYTDGVPEATNASEELFGTTRMLEALNMKPDAVPEEILANVHQAVDDFVKEAEQFDDLTMMCLEYRHKGRGTVKAKKGTKDTKKKTKKEQG